MGGKALSVASLRLPAARYHQVAAEIAERLVDLVVGRVRVIPAYNQKPDFGDIDVIVESTPQYDPYKIAKALGCTEVVVNGDCASLGYPVDGWVFQLDLIKIPSISFEFAYCYFSYNDVGNLLGRIAHKAGLKFGHLGLFYPMRDRDEGTHLLGEPFVTRDFGAALKLLGYNPVTYMHCIETGVGFDSLEEIFRFVVSSPFTNPDIYILDNRNHAAKMRDRKRPTYQKFLKWMQEQPEGALHRFPWAPGGSTDRTYQKEAFLKMCFSLNPEFEKEYNQIMDLFDRRRSTKARFNGGLVSELTGLSGKELGGLMTWIKKQFETEGNLMDFVLTQNPDQIKHMILGYHETWLESKLCQQ
jgi:hypothetical protein